MKNRLRCHWVEQKPRTAITRHGFHSYGIYAAENRLYNVVLSVSFSISCRRRYSQQTMANIFNWICRLEKGQLQLPTAHRRFSPSHAFRLNSILKLRSMVGARSRATTQRFRIINFATWRRIYFFAWSLIRKHYRTEGWLFVFAQVSGVHFRFAFVFTENWYIYCDSSIT